MSFLYPVFFSINNEKDILGAFYTPLKRQKKEPVKYVKYRETRIIKHSYSNLFYEMARKANG